MHQPETWGILQFEDSTEVGATYYRVGRPFDDGVFRATKPRNARKHSRVPRSGRAEVRPWPSTMRSMRMLQSMKVPKVLGVNVLLSWRSVDFARWRSQTLL